MVHFYLSAEPFPIVQMCMLSHSSVEEHVGYVQYFTTVNTLVQPVICFHFWGHMSRSVTAELYVKSSFSFMPFF